MKQKQIIQVEAKTFDLEISSVGNEKKVSITERGPGYQYQVSLSCYNVGWLSECFLEAVNWDKNLWLISFKEGTRVLLFRRSENP